MYTWNYNQIKLNFKMINIQHLNSVLLSSSNDCTSYLILRQTKTKRSFLTYTLLKSAEDFIFDGFSY